MALFSEDPSLYLGAHMSIAGGMSRAVDRAEQVRATALQVFVKSARQWDAKPLAPQEAEEFRRRLDDSGLSTHTLAHTSYLINLASPDRAMRERSIRALRDELGRCASLGVPYLVLHPGSHVGQGEERGLERVTSALDRILAPRRPSRAAVSGRPVTVLLEVTAGQGSNLGHRFEHLAWILEHARCTERLGVCFDTCHAWAAGYDLRDKKSFDTTFAAFERIIGLERLKAFHLNDSKNGLGSRKDRHEHIGRGELGLSSFRRLLNDRRFAELPMVLETPKKEDLAEDRENLAVLRSLIRSRKRE
jgi:deoxyribonuclease-4